VVLLTPEVAGRVAETCRANAAEVASAFARALGLEGEVSVGDARVAGAGLLATGLGGPGLAITLAVGEAAALVLIPNTHGRLPAWCESPDATGESRLATLAQELGLRLLPEELTPGHFQARYVPDLAALVAECGISQRAAFVPLELRTPDGSVVAMQLAWPAMQAEAALGEARDHDGAEGARAPTPGWTPPGPANPRPMRATSARTLDDLPTYARSLLRIKVPVVVTLTQKRQLLSRILELGPGSMVQFDKSCEEMLDLHAGGHRVAMGEAVKVGDKFGLRITSMVLPGERFQKVAPEASSISEAAG